MDRWLRGLAVAAAASAMLALGAAPALAHEEVAVGDLALVIGFGTEPAYSDQPNSVEVVVTHGGDPVTDLRPGDLEVEVSFGDAATTMDLEPNFVVGAFGEPGDYRAWFVPTEPGGYTFRVTGTIDGEEVDETVRSGPQTFSDVIDVAEVSFPPNEAPTNDELATRIQQDAGRLNDAVAAASAAADDAASARSTGTIAIVIAAIGVLAGIAGIASARAARTRTG
jgi:hypothetical protein